MARIRHLRNAPIAEAIVDFRVSFPGDFRPVRLREAKERLAQRYPEALERKGLETRLEIAAGLLDAFEEASRPNWDGYGAYPVSGITVAHARAFLDLLPSTLPRPEISPHPDGELAFEWSFAPRRLLTVSVNESGRLSYAALFGQARLHGTEFLLDAMPEAVALALRRLHAAE